MKRYIVLLLSLASSLMGTRDIEQLHLNQVLGQLKQYRLNAAWIADECMFLKIEQFDIVWGEVVDILTQSERRWFYFCDKPEDYSDETYWKYAVWQCHVYDEWLSKLCLDIKTNELLVFDKKAAQVKQLATIFDYWDFKAKIESKEKKYYQFYAFYVDVLTKLYNEYINNAKEQINDFKEFARLFDLAKECLASIESCLERIRECKQYPQYLFAFKSLHEIFEILKQERASGVS